MTARRPALLLVGGWGLLVLAGLVVPMVAVWDRLPDPMAVHWDLGGRPDGDLGRAWSVGFMSALWLLLCGVGIGIAAAPGNRYVRAGLGAMLANTGVVLLGVQGLIVWANLDRSSWQDARELGGARWWLLLAVALLLVAMSWTLLWAARQAQQDTRQRRTAPAMDLDATVHTVWVTRAVNHWMIAVGLALLAVAAVATLLTLAELSTALLLGVTVGVTGMLLVWFSAVGVVVDRAGLRISLGPWGWPAWRIQLSDIRGAWVEDRPALSVGGWGYRVHPDGQTLMIRSGSCLVIDRPPRRQFAVSVDDADRAAGLLNALRAAGPADSAATG